MRKRAVVAVLLILAFFMQGCSVPSVIENEEVEAVSEYASPQASSTRIKITAQDTVIYANMYDNPTAQAFIELLPLTLSAFDRIGLVKSTILPQRISDEGERTREYTKGAIFYWPDGTELAVCDSDYLPETVVDIVHIGMIESGVDLFENCTGDLLIELKEEEV